ncbi:unnamed protein product [Rotaria sordida]|uniref:F-box domain-containing protein n=1 Tax=Rotaria sordida TaxID=392033 RepID=A0A818KLI1_9BILA|nr:unnamed protein product [Rotaria sordida]CAF1275865.1 unnamed protein product [Rotaria sordida]CAF3509342.1 unnamed protein product [Rotaria sordida]CAF3554169.1 unnamed protein product [Rotaria sordida]
MKFRIKFHNQTSSITFDDINENLSINDLKNTIINNFPSLRQSNFHLSLNGRDLLDENQTISQSGLVNGDTIYILNEINNDNLSSLSISSIDQPLTLDEVRDLQTYPKLIHHLVEHSRPENDFDYMVIVIHALMLESGFQMDAENNYDLKIARKSSTFYVIRYRHKLCEKERIRCSLAIMKTDSLVTIDGVVNSISQACGKLSFNIGNYLHTQKEAIALNAAFPYHNLRDLSRLFKDNLANRLLCKLLEESGQRSSATLIGLPNEIKLRLGKYLPIKSLLALQLTCRDIHNTLNDNLFWHDLCIRDFDKTAITSVSNTTQNSSNEKNWHKLYQIMYAQKQAILRHQTKYSPFFHTTFVPLAPPPGHPTHRVLFPDPTNAASAAFHPFPPAIYRPIPPGVFRICTANTQQAQTTQHQQAQHHIYCQPLFGLKWVVIFAAATMIPLPPCFHPVWLG